MADVRALLRQERASRQSGPKRSAVPAAAPTSRKRKAADDDGDERKRTRTEEDAGVPSGFFDDGAEDDVSPPSPSQTAPEEQAAAEEEEKPEADPQPQVLQTPNPSVPRLDAAAQAELDAFLSEMADEPVVQQGLPTYSAGAVIEAAPMTTAEIAAQAREDMSTQRAKKDEEMEAEKEDAARQLEDEFEEMEGLEERFKKLREQREALRSARAQAKVEEIVLSEPQPEHVESDSDDEEWDDWRFRAA
jgi:hypothetical protein